MAKRYERNKDQIGKKYRKRKVERKERILKRQSENSGLSGYEILNKKKGKLNLDLLEVCKSCKIEFWDTSILRHLKDPACRKDYDLEELEYITGWSEKRKELVYFDYCERNKEEIKQRSKERWAENKESILNQRREHLEKKGNDKQQLLKKCKSCNKKFGDNQILGHIDAKDSLCKKDYSEDELAYIQNFARERKKMKEANYRKEHKALLLPNRQSGTKRKERKKRRKIEKKVLQRTK